MPQVDESLRRQFESDWIAGNARRIDDYLPPADSENYLPTLEELVCIDLERRWALHGSEANWGTLVGADLESADSECPLVESYLSRFPQLRQPARIQRLVDHEISVRERSSVPPSPNEYANRFPELGLTPSSVERKRVSFATIDQTPTSAPTLPPPRRSLGPYRFLRRLGRGGMGSVFEAHHETSDRVVALKIAEVNHLHEEARVEAVKRIEKEIRAAAMLHDDHLVPLLDVGQIDDQIYYTMPVFDTDLASEIRENPMTGRRAADAISQAAKGIQVAHDAGLLHRDIKPHNLMLDRGKQRVLVADFGLARQTNDQDQLTHTGHVLGTPPYASPEQLKTPHKIDHRADVYSLGATLYHLLTGRPPFVAAEPAETVRQVFDQDPIPPKDLNSTIDLDLNTICIKCLHKERSLRYQSAADLADDLDRYLRNEPINARPLGSLERLARWRKRNPQLAIATGGLFIALSLCVLVGLIGWWTTNNQLSRANGLLDENLDALDELFSLIQNDPEFAGVGRESIRRELLQKAQAHYDTLATTEVDSPRVAGDRFATSVKIALLTEELDGPAPALELLQDAVNEHGRLNRHAKNQPVVKRSYGDAYNGMGEALRKLKRLDEAITAFDQAVQIRQDFVDSELADFESRRKLANAIMNRGIVFAALGRVDQAEEDQRDAQSQREQLTKLHASSERLQRDHAQGQYNLARLHWQTGADQHAGALLDEAIASFEQLVLNRPDAEMLRLRKVECHLLRSEMAWEQNDTPEAIEQANASLSVAIETYRQLAMLAPANRNFRIRLIDLAHQLIEQTLAFGSENATDRASQVWTQVQTLLLDRFDANDRQPDLRQRLIEQRRIGGMISLGRGQRAQAKTQLLDAVKAWREFRSEEAEAETGVDAIWDDTEAFARSL